MGSAPPHLDSSQLPAELLTELWLIAQPDAYALTKPEFETILLTTGVRSNFGLPANHQPSLAEQARFLRGLNLPDLALAQACALGRDSAWQHFIARYRESLTRFAIKTTHSTSLGQDLADSLYAELFGLGERENQHGHAQRKSPLASYSGRGALLVWLRAALAQRFIDQHRRTHRELPLDNHDYPSPNLTPTPNPETLTQLTTALTQAILTLSPDDRLLLASYFLDQSTLAQIARLTGVHEATISRKIKRLTSTLHAQLLQCLQDSGMNPRAAQEALGTDPRDISINLRNLLQQSPLSTFPNQETLPETRPS